MPPPMLQHIHISADPSTTIKCHSLQWDVRPRWTRKPTKAAHGHIIRLMDGISSYHQNTIAHTIATSSTQRANDYPIQSNFNTNASPIPPSRTPTKWCKHWSNASKPSKEWQVKTETLKPHRTYNVSLMQHRLRYKHISTNLKKPLPQTIFAKRNEFRGCRHQQALPYPIPMTTDESRTPCKCRHQFQGCPETFLLSNHSARLTSQLSPDQAANPLH